MPVRNNKQCPGTFKCEDLDQAYSFLKNQALEYEQSFKEFPELDKPNWTLDTKLAWIELTKKKYEYYRDEVSRLRGDTGGIPFELNYMEARN